MSVLNRFGLARAAIVTGARAASGAPLPSLPRLLALTWSFEILDPLALETGVAIAAFIVDRPHAVGALHASKAALHQMVKFLAVELAPKNIRVNLPPRRVTS